jgi:hypothetical protein
MKTPIEMLESVNAEIIENTALLELIYKNSAEDPQLDCAIACLLRSLYRTREKAEIYVEEIISNTEGKRQ